MDYLIGDTIRLQATIKNFAGALSAPGNNPTVSVFDLDGTELLTSGASSSGSSGSAEYYYDWKVLSTGTNALTANANLIAVWSWDDTHKKKMTFSVITVLS
jgi:hypothetical protein